MEAVKNVKDAFFGSGNEQVRRLKFALIAAVSGQGDEWKILNVSKLKPKNGSVDLNGTKFSFEYRTNFAYSLKHEVLATDNDLNDFTSNVGSTKQDSVPTFKACIDCEKENWSFNTTAVENVVRAICEDNQSFKCWLKKSLSPTVGYMKNNGVTTEGAVSTCKIAVAAVNQYLKNAAAALESTGVIKQRWDMAYLSDYRFIPETSVDKYAKFVPLRRAFLASILMGLPYMNEKQRKDSARMVGKQMNGYMSSDGEEEIKGDNVLRACIRDTSMISQDPLTESEMKLRTMIFLAEEFFRNMRRTLNIVMYKQNASALTMRNADEKNIYAQKNEFKPQTWAAIEGNAIRNLAISTKGLKTEEVDNNYMVSDIKREAYNLIKNILTLKLPGVDSELKTKLLPEFSMELINYSRNNIEYTGKVFFFCCIIYYGSKINCTFRLCKKSHKSY